MHTVPAMLSQEKEWERGLSGSATTLLPQAAAGNKRDEGIRLVVKESIVCCLSIGLSPLLKSKEIGIDRSF